MYNSIFSEVHQLLEKENTKIGKKAFSFLNEEIIIDIIEDDGIFWFEHHSYQESLPNYIYDYLVKFIKRKMNLKPLRV